MPPVLGWKASLCQRVPRRWHPEDPSRGSRSSGWRRVQQASRDTVRVANSTPRGTAMGVRCLSRDVRSASTTRTAAAPDSFRQPARVSGIGNAGQVPPLREHTLIHGVHKTLT